MNHTKEGWKLLHVVLMLRNQFPEGRSLKNLLAICCMKSDFVCVFSIDSICLSEDVI